MLRAEGPGLLPAKGQAQSPVLGSMAPSTRLADWVAFLPKALTLGASLPLGHPHQSHLTFYAMKYKPSKTTVNI